MPTVEVLFDPYIAAIACGGMPCDPRQHEILPDGEWVSYLQRRLNMPELFVYHHRFRHTFVVAGWGHPPADPNGTGGVMFELEVMSGPPDWNPSDRPSMGFMVRRTAPVREQAKRAMQVLRENVMADRAAQDTSSGELAERIRSLRLGGQTDEANMLQAGISSHVGQGEGGEVLEHMTEELTHMVKDTG